MRRDVYDRLRAIPHLVLRRKPHPLPAGPGVHPKPRRLMVWRYLRPFAGFIAIERSHESRLPVRKRPWHLDTNAVTLSACGIPAAIVRPGVSATSSVYSQPTQPLQIERREKTLRSCNGRCDLVRDCLLNDPPHGRPPGFVKRADSTREAATSDKQARAASSEPLPCSAPTHNDGFQDASKPLYSYPALALGFPRPRWHR